MAQRVLIIDDSPTIHSLVTARLRSEPIEIYSALNGTDGLKLAHEMQPDLILLDAEMPAPDGFEVCRQLKSDPATLSVPIVFLSGASSSKDKIIGLELGAVDYVTKPFDPAELQARVRATLRTKYLMDLLSKRAQIDGLTGLWNRSYLHHRLLQEINLFRRHRCPLTCLLADVDHFKLINDNYGHPRGDDVLRALGAVLVDCCRREDIVCRFGGEEFAIIAPNTPLEGAVRMAKRITDMLQQRPLSTNVAGEPLFVTISMGIATAIPTDTELSIIEAADQALYQAKRNGRSRFEISRRLALPQPKPGDVPSLLGLGVIRDAEEELRTSGRDRPPLAEAS